MRSILSAAIAMLLAGCTPLPQATGPARSSEPVAWTQFGLGEQAGLIARALVDRAEACPTVDWDGKVEAMTLRDPLRVEPFGKLCESRRSLAETLEVKIRRGRTVLLDQRVTRRPERIAVVGDTGCRLTYDYDQECADRSKWPFVTIAASMADKQPDLILHLGDYYYREVPCLGTSTKCEAGPYGDREPSWRAEFFEPARPLIAKAPWVFARGNHEDCQLGGYGWAYYFGDAPEACATAHPTAFIRLNGLTVVNFDTAATGNRLAARDLDRNWDSVSGALRSLPPASAGEPILLMTHEPGYFFCTGEQGRLEACKESKVGAIAGVRSMASVARESGWRTIMLSGHIHAFRMLDVSPPTLGGRSVTQVVVGTGGASQEGAETPSAMIPPAIVETRFRDALDKLDLPIRAQGWSGFGFGMLNAASLQLAMFDAHGRPLFTCALAEETSPRRCR